MSKLKPWQDRFAMEYHITGNAKRAYLNHHEPRKNAKQAQHWAPEAIYNAASKLLNSRDIQVRLEELKQQAQEAHGYQVADAMKELEAAYEAAKAANQATPMVAAVKAKIDLLGLKPAERYDHTINQAPTQPPVQIPIHVQIPTGCERADAPTNSAAPAD